MIVAVNKWDLMEDSEENREAFARRVLRRLRFTPWAPLAFVSAKTGLNVEGLLELATEIGETRSQRIPTAQVNAALREAVARTRRLAREAAAAHQVRDAGGRAAAHFRLLRERREPVTLLLPAIP